MENHSDLSKNFIPYDLALELKELGFDEPCFGFYVPLLDGTQEFELMKFESQGKKVVLAPLWQQAFRWLYQKVDIEKGIMPLDTESQQLLLKELIDKVSSKHLLV